MAKRPPSTPTAEEDVAKTQDAVVPESNESIVQPVAMEEPARLGPDSVEVEVEAEGVETTPPTRADGPSIEQEPESMAITPPAKRTSGNGFWGSVLGGGIAAAAGYILAIFVPFPGIGTSDSPPLVTQPEAQALAARIEALESAPAPDASLADRIALLEARPEQVASAEQDLSPLTEALAALEDRIALLEASGPAVSGEAPSADLAALVESLRIEVAEMQASGADASAGIEALTAQTEARLAEAEAQAEKLRAEAEATARRAVTAAALGRIQAALESGSPFSGALADIPDAEIPSALTSLAETGVPSRAALEDAFPPAARAALEASLRADMGEGWSERIASFLQATAGVRSLSPREGTDPDAVLSRAEAAVRSGDFSQALAELQALPPEGLSEMSDWSAMAQQRLDAVAAAASLSAAVEG